MNPLQIMSEWHLDTSKPRVQEILSSYSVEDGVLDVMADLDLIVSICDLHPDVIRELRRYWVDHQPSTSVAAMILLVRGLVVEHAHPSEWLVNQEPYRDGETERHAAVLSLLAIAAHQVRRFRKMNLDEQHITFNLGHLKNYINNHYDSHGTIGSGNYTWCLYLASIGLIHLHTLHFMHHVFTDRCVLFRHRRSHRLIMLALDGIEVRQDGQFEGVNDSHDYWFTTTYQETETCYQGYRVNPYGAITDRVMELNRSEYDVVLKPGDATIDYHIPTGPGYNLDDVKQSFREAVSFFSKLYPQYDYRAFWCVSWLSSPQIPLFVSKQQGNIFQINQQSYTFPAMHGQESILEFVFHDKHADIRTLQPTTTLEHDIVTYLLDGHTINCGIFLFPLEDLEAFGTSPYRSETDWQEFQSLQKNRTP